MPKKNPNVRKATKEERIAVRATKARKVARKEGELVAIYTGEKGGRLVTSRNSGQFAKPSHTSRTKGIVNTRKALGGNVASKRNTEFREGLAGEENSDFYTHTKLGRRILSKANRNALRLGKPTQGGYTGGGLNANKPFKEVPIKKRFQGRTS